MYRICVAETLEVRGFPNLDPLLSLQSLPVPLAAESLSTVSDTQLLLKHEGLCLLHSFNNLAER